MTKEPGFLICNVRNKSTSAQHTVFIKPPHPLPSSQDDPLAMSFRNLFFARVSEYGVSCFNIDFVAFSSSITVDWDFSYLIIRKFFFL